MFWTLIIGGIFLYMLIGFTTYRVQYNIAYHRYAGSHEYSKYADEWAEEAARPFVVFWAPRLIFVGLCIAIGWLFDDVIGGLIRLWFKAVDAVQRKLTGIPPKKLLPPPPVASDSTALVKAD